MPVEAKRFLPRVALLPFLAAGAMALGSTNTPVAEAGGCNGEQVVTSGNISPETFAELEELCKQAAFSNREYINLRNRENQDRNNFLIASISALTGSIALGYSIAKHSKWGKS